ncbi:MAG: polysaccharide deacetylase family protein [Bacteroidota bacterium]
MYLVKTPKFIQNLFPNFIWKIPAKEKVLYLTFDDGPIPQVTPWVLDQLKAYEAKATFFCVGENVQRHPDVFQQVLDAGHSVGNHTFNHLNGWGTDNIPYFHNVRHCAHLVNSNLFRPPYGRLMPRQAQFLQRHYRIIMWDVLSGDFDPKLSKDQCLKNVTDKVKPGSIVVFHDSLKAQEKLQYVLPQVLEHFTAAGYQFESLHAQAFNSKPTLSKTA